MSELTRRWSLGSRDVQKRFWHSLQTYGFTPSWRQAESALRWQFWLNFFWQILHVNQVPSPCDFSRCTFSWSSLLKQSEQCLYMSTATHISKCFTIVSECLKLLSHKPQEIMFDVWVNHMTMSQCIRRTETHWTFTTNIRLHAFMTPKWTWRFSSVFDVKQLPIVRSVMWSSVAVYKTFMNLQVAVCRLSTHE